MYIYFTLKESVLFLQKNYIQLLSQGSKDIADAVKRTLSEIISKPVQLKYSGCGEENVIKKKKVLKTQIHMLL